MRLLPVLPALLLAACVTNYKVDTDEGRTSSDDDLDTADTADTAVADADGDGTPASEDCDDTDPAVHPGAVELCNTRDDDCDGAVDEDATEPGTWYVDADGDGYGDDATAVQSCEPPAEGMVLRGGDCDDASAARSPGNDEVCDEVDNDCDGSVDEDPSDGRTYYADTDGDGFGDPSAAVVACAQPDGMTWDASDCDDTRAAVNPLAVEICNDLDDNCDGTLDTDAVDATTWYADADGDGYGDPDSAVTTCDAPLGHIAVAGDCEDADAAVSPAADEVCNFVDDDCDGSVDEDALDATTWYADYDSDGHGATYDSLRACEAPPGFLPTGDDCDDGAPNVYAGATEVCDDLDNDCDGSVDDEAVDRGMYFADTDGDGFGEPGTLSMRCNGADNELDCDDYDATEPVVVDAARGSSGGTGSAASPLASIDRGIARAGTCVLVFPGTYFETVDFNGNDVVVSSVGGSGVTTIDATSTGGAVVSFTTGESAGAVLEGFTLLGGSGRVESSTSSSGCGSTSTCTTYTSTYCGGGIVADYASPTLRDLVVQFNNLPVASTTTAGTDTYVVSSFGGGACFVGSSATLTDVDFYENYADDGGGVYVDAASSLAFSRVRLAANAATSGAGLHVDGGTLSVTNLLSSWNAASSVGGGLLLESGGTFTGTNVTSAYDEAASQGGGFLVDSSTVTLRNGIVGYATAGGGIYGVGAVTHTQRYSNVFGNTGGNYAGTATSMTGTSGNISADPRFRAVSDDGNVYNDDFTLVIGSPSINTGDPSSVYNDPDGSRANMGAYGGPGSF